ncbi:hypothetical protein [Vasconcelosia minhoensis]|uniref:hypothetical protein n=1 Tax=Vasconcelosia minhoensis TaxID=3366354 RepID=UPI001D133663|nr:hypothetical protein [Romeria gracilis]
MPIDFQTFVAIFAALLVFLTGVTLSYDALEFTAYRILLPQWVGLLLAAVTFFTVAVDQILRGFIRVEEVQRRVEEKQRSAEEAERAARRARIEAGCRAGQIRFQLEPSAEHRRELAAVLALLYSSRFGLELIL